KREVARLPGGHSIAFSPDGRRLAISGGEEKAVGVWDLESRRQLVALASDGSGGRGVGFSPDGNVIGAVNSRGDMFLWRAPTFEEIAAVEARRQKENRGTMTPSGEKALFTSAPEIPDRRMPDSHEKQQKLQAAAPERRLH
ncbi:MAG TPA: WD40 repeat domain-containing protein, partial [Lacipirellulaceae bacterium]|nr:WD40 repeat domain-containing protein [Lacipirellulaceae bacterium]